MSWIRSTLEKKNKGVADELKSIFSYFNSEIRFFLFGFFLLIAEFSLRGVVSFTLRLPLDGLGIWSELATVEIEVSLRWDVDVRHSCTCSETCVELASSFGVDDIGI